MEDEKRNEIRKRSKQALKVFLKKPNISLNVHPIKRIPSFEFQETKEYVKISFNF